MRTLNGAIHRKRPLESKKLDIKCGSTTNQCYQGFQIHTLCSKRAKQIACVEPNSCCWSNSGGLWIHFVGQFVGCNPCVIHLYSNLQLWSHELHQLGSQFTWASSFHRLLERAKNQTSMLYKYHCQLQCWWTSSTLWVVHLNSSQINGYFTYLFPLKVLFLSSKPSWCGSPHPALRLEAFKD